LKKPKLALNGVIPKNNFNDKSSDVVIINVIMNGIADIQSSASFAVSDMYIHTLGGNLAFDELFFNKINRFSFDYYLKHGLFTVKFLFILDFNKESARNLNQIILYLKTVYIPLEVGRIGVLAVPLYRKSASCWDQQRLGKSIDGNYPLALRK
jgi:hypothetical protein